ncbi:hypothetical protein PBY51_023936 [Eleginops maclovinus]|uniref:Uncharacterized protein n=1 Tax=Eleginops maclovinus TaxID=56733 RepID=A0AAN7X0Y2_ELEMC|nr:hypothetical protein PBY51_023936 [Eleginops maclovinus]
MSLLELVQYFLWSPSPPDTRTARPYADRTLRRSLGPRAKKQNSKVRRRLVRKEPNEREAINSGWTEKTGSGQ